MPSQQIAIANSQFLVVDTFNSDLQCRVTVVVKTLLYDTGHEYYDISYSYTYKTEDSKHLNPFNDNLASQSDEGDIIIKNAMTTQMVTYLLKDEDELAREIGNHCPIQYKSQIMRALSLFWD